MLQNIINIFKKIVEAAMPLLRKFFKPKEPWEVMAKLYKKNNIVSQLVNLCAVRNIVDPEKGLWNDVMIIWGEGYLRKDWGTTDPGPYWTKNAKRYWGVDGVFHLALGYHPRLWILGKHKGYNAFVQRGIAKGWRDYNENYIQDKNEPFSEYGRGINGHHGGNAHKIGKYSAGCQVRESVSAHKTVYNIAKDSNQKFFHYFIFDIDQVPMQFKIVGQNQ